MTTREILLLTLLIFSCGYIASEHIHSDLPIISITPILALIGAFLGILFNRLKHVDDLNLSRKKEVSLEYIKYVSEYRSALIGISDHSLSTEDFHKNLMEATKNMVGALDKLHVVSDDDVSSKIERKNYDLTMLMLKMNQKLQECGEDKLSILKWFISEDIGKQMNDIRYEIIRLINTEIGDKSGTKKLKEAFDKNNSEFKASLSVVLGIESDKC
mgnify:CR=1 FL=1